MNIKTRVAAAALGVLTLAAAARPCTAFYIFTGGETVVGKSFDWSTCEGLVVVNKRGIAKEALVADENRARWVSTYGSVTFNQYGREMPLGGMNEVGLVIEVLWLDESLYPAPDERPAVGCLQWVQYALDTCATVEEAVATLEEIRVADDDTGRVHYFVADAAGGCGAAEFVGGKAVVHAGDYMPARALANNTYDESLAFLSMYAERDGTPDDIAGDGSLERFSRAAIAAGDFDVSFLFAEAAATYAVGVLDDVAMPDRSQWRIVYDVTGGRVHFRTRENMETRWFKPAAFDYSPATPVKIFDMNAPGGGDVTEEFVDYSYEANRALIDASFAGTEFLKEVPEETREALARYPDTLGAPE
jgi:penicillin V acylase-like amidase (Ntn superfamily)